jgi:HSP20 family protein
MFNRQATTEAQNQQGFNQFGRGCGRGFGGKFGHKFGGAFGGKAPWMQAFGNRKSANIAETDTQFIISLYAAGLNKSDFKISVTDDVLIISYAATETTESESKYTYQEYQPSSFERSFQLNGKALTDNISATYVDGVLKVTLAKNPDTNKPAQEVKVD